MTQGKDSTFVIVWFIFMVLMAIVFGFPEWLIP
jgi:hypothetical protein